MSKQLPRSSTSIGTNIAEGIFARTRADFGLKLSIAQKEAAETAYRIELLHATEYIATEQFTSINNDCLELIKLLQSITKTVYNK